MSLLFNMLQQVAHKNSPLVHPPHPLPLLFLETDRKDTDTWRRVLGSLYLDHLRVDQPVRGDTPSPQLGMGRLESRGPRRGPEQSPKARSPGCFHISLSKASFLATRGPGKPEWARICAMKKGSVRDRIKVCEKNPEIHLLRMKHGATKPCLIMSCAGNIWSIQIKMGVVSSLPT